jgi:hypothetical protein
MVNSGNSARFSAEKAEQNAFNALISLQPLSTRARIRLLAKAAPIPKEHNSGVRPEAAPAATMMFVPRANQR